MDRGAWWTLVQWGRRRVGCNLATKQKQLSVYTHTHAYTHTHTHLPLKSFAQKKKKKAEEFCLNSLSFSWALLGLQHRIQPTCIPRTSECCSQLIVKFFKTCRGRSQAYVISDFEVWLKRSWGVGRDGLFLFLCSGHGCIASCAIG